MIAHRLITLKNCDMILQLENGRLVDIMKPAEIMRQMAELYATQSYDDNSIVD